MQNAANHEYAKGKEEEEEGNDNRQVYKQTKSGNKMCFSAIVLK